MNLSTILVASVVALILAAIAASAIRNRKKGRHGCACGGGCAGCSMNGACHRANDPQ